MMPKAERDGRRASAGCCLCDCDDCREVVCELCDHADEMDAFLRELDGMLARGELATAVQTKIGVMLSELEK